MKISLILLVLVLVGCAPRQTIYADMVDDIPTNFPNGVSRFVDKEAGVVCWVYEDDYSGGISCIPLPQLPIGNKVAQ